jgi:hypothetical protein
MIIDVAYAIGYDLHSRSPQSWNMPEHALAYLQQADAIPHRVKGRRRCSNSFLRAGEGS